MNSFDVPKTFWTFYDLYRRKQISLHQFSIKSNIELAMLVAYLKEISYNVEEQDDSRNM